MMRGLVLCLALVGCGRIGFDTTRDGGDDAGSDADSGHDGGNVFGLPLACNVAADLGPIAPFAVGTNSEVSLAAATTSFGLVIAHSAAGGYVTQPIDLSVTPPVGGAEVPLGLTAGAELDAAANTTAALFSWRTGGATQTLVTDLFGDQQNLMAQPGIAIAAPDHTQVAPDGFFIVDSDGSRFIRHHLDATGADLGISAHPLLQASGGSLAALSDKTASVFWSSASSSCEVAIENFAGTNASLRRATVADCDQYVRIAAAPDGSHVAIFFTGSFGPLRTVVLDGDLMTQTDAADVAPFITQPTRSVGAREAYWSITSTDNNSLAIYATAFATGSTLVARTEPMGAFGSGAEFDLVNLDGEAIAVWGDSISTPHLWVERLCL